MTVVAMSDDVPKSFAVLTTCLHGLELVVAQQLISEGTVSYLMRRIWTIEIPND